MDNWHWAVTGLSIAGVVLNIYQKRICFVIWLVTNAIWCIIDFGRGLYAQAVLFAVYLLLAIWGLLRWR
jgi:nicotinamide riboside transporter PnuC